MARRTKLPAQNTVIPSFSLYGEQEEFLDILHCEQILDRAKNLGWSIKPHRHSNLHQFFLLAKGTATAKIDNIPHKFNGPMLISIPRMVVHSFEFSIGTIGYVLSIPNETVTQVLGQETELTLIENNAIVFPADTYFMSLIEQIYAEHWANDPLKLPFLRALCSLLFCHFARQCSQELGNSRSNLYSFDIRKFDTLVRQHVAKNWSISEYAAALGCSRTHLNRMCRAATGHSPRDYIIQRSIQEARRLLTYTELDIATIGFRLGFDDPSYFSRSFKRLTGLSPSVYRFSNGLTG